MADLLPGGAKVLDLVSGLRSQIETVRKEALPPQDTGLGQHGVELPSGRAYEGSAFPLLVFTPGFAHEGYLVGHLRQIPRILRSASYML